MICPKCDTVCQHNYCVRCGIFFKSDNEYFLPKENPHEHDLEIFVGKNSEKIIYRNFNLSAAFFNFLYYLYRKCYLFGIILFLIQIALYYIWVILLNNNYIYIVLANFLFFMIFGNSIYLGISKTKIKKIIKKENFKDYLAIKGGTNIVFALIAALIIFFIISFLIFAKII